MTIHIKELKEAREIRHGLLSIPPDGSKIIRKNEREYYDSAWQYHLYLLVSVISSFFYGPEDLDEDVKIGECFCNVFSSVGDSSSMRYKVLDLNQDDLQHMHWIVHANDIPPESNNPYAGTENKNKAAQRKLEEIKKKYFNEKFDPSKDRIQKHALLGVAATLARDGDVPWDKNEYNELCQIKHANDRFGPYADASSHYNHYFAKLGDQSSEAQASLQKIVNSDKFTKNTKRDPLFINKMQKAVGLNGE